MRALHLTGRPEGLHFVLLALVLGVAGPAFAQPAAPQNTCLACHSTLADARLSRPAAQFSGTDVHRDRGFACVDCHGGDATAADEAGAHSAARGFHGAPRGQAQIAACARCHSDAALMRRFAPSERVDQAAEYATSVHGMRLAQGDTRVATCASCHGAHGIRPVGDVQSPVYPTHVADTCATCHADPQHMAGYTTSGGDPLPTTQFAEYRTSVHYQALAGGDLSAPTCNDCHGNHGATPPGVDSIVNVCGTCHAVFAEKFATSAHAFVFDRGCVECHGNHAVAKPTEALLGTGDGALCGACHSDDAGAAAAQHMRQAIDGLKDRLDASTARIAALGNEGIEVGDDELELREARNALTLARTNLHAFTPDAIDEAVASGTGTLDKVDAAAEAGARELSFRRRGLAVSLVLILVFVVALFLKIRSLDKRVIG
jgi:predicted CXXCH cytochrome family protein